MFSKLIICFLPILTLGLITKYDPIAINSASLIYQKYYMFDKETSPASNNIGNGNSYLEMSFNITKNIPNVYSRGTIEAYFASEDFFQKVGYHDGEKQVACCDEAALNGNHCTNMNHLIIPSDTGYAFKKTEIEFEGDATSLFLHFEVPKEGKYYMILGLCDPSTANLNITGSTIVMNPYGHVPARLYGIIPFSKLLLLCYSVLLLMWIRRCLVYRKELMSVHFMITMVLVIFVIDCIIKLINVQSYNTHGSYITSITIVSLIFSAATRTVARCLTIMVAMGLGVSKATIGKAGWRITAIAMIYFCFCLWDSISTTFATTSEINFYRIIPASLLDSIIYYWILQALLDTIQELEDKKQTSKLDVFIKLRNMIIVIVVISTIYNIGFSWLIIQNLLENLWKYQWFFNDGVWSVFYFLIICSIIFLWAPNERSLAYAYHVQVSTDEHLEGEANNQDGALQPTTEENVQVQTVDSTANSLKPMEIKEGSA